MHVVVCGGGVIGACCAYFLALRGARVSVIERAGVASAASGKSGGFLALDWNDNSPLGELARHSFRLHERLAGGFADDWGFRHLETLSVAASTSRDISRLGRGPLPDWIHPGAALQGLLGTEQTTAQVHPALFTKAIIKLAQNAGARLIAGRVDGLGLSPDGRAVKSVTVDHDICEADAVVIAMGPWSALAGQWLPLPAVHGLKGNSVVFRPDRDVGAHALFADVELAGGHTLSPEIYPRPDGTVYVCGLSSEPPLDDDPASVMPDAGAAARIRDAAAAVAPVLATAELVAEQACYRPVVYDGLPLIGRVAGIAGAYVATGHSVWGILNAPATGEAIAELIVDGRSTLDLAPFDPGRLSVNYSR
jgi:glycine/D-amino acid oxidase-like deaminating enzyme